jgi:chemotaxis protein CheD
VSDHVIHAGGVFVAKGPGRVRTLLGSCIAACIYDPIAGVGGMNHFMLPHICDGVQSARCGMVAMELLIDGLLKNGAQRDRLRAKVFGASYVLASSHQDIPAINIAFIRQYLGESNIPIIAEKLGRHHGLQVVFEIDSGRAFVRELPATDDSAIIGEDLRYARQMHKCPRSQSGDPEAP